MNKKMSLINESLSSVNEWMISIDYGTLKLNMKVNITVPNVKEPLIIICVTFMVSYPMKILSCDTGCGWACKFCNDDYVAGWWSMWENNLSFLVRIYCIT